ncbi:PRC-barrel domain-containing protein [Roseicella aerolata]|uniref:PRC-barrel domain-containing protein n=1 Tax=Roseicella aerolata TaxID=2883479 RepID=A0A9X1L8T3_9PROT|nr:PRC-barrel domain-containing protein [Roseicella aerolata]MCB4820253.1 PRC-barrel domain-containing protein [Roseicella aerolata]
MTQRDDTVAPGVAGQVAREETRELIAAGKVAGTPVYNRTGENLGTIEDLMLDKRMGRVAYAVMSFGGFLGFGERYHPLPWSVLTYDTSLGGYVVDIDRDRLEGAPAYAADAAPDWSSRDWGRQVDDYWGARSIWDPRAP